ncbi:MAG: YihY/virulence factor BrkB family protein [Methylobacteriaceae bacterium]|nr:YihY/virulence factor BrkB family protein [Methylobacteriaceae bacterium]
MAKQEKATPRPGPLVWAAALVLLTLAEAGHRTAASGLEVVGTAKRDAAAKAGDGRNTKGKKDGKNAVKPEGAGPQPGEAPTAPTPDQPASPKGVWEILKRVFIRLNDDNLTLVAAGVAFYGLLAIFPALGALVAIYGLVADPHKVMEMAADISAFIPAEAAKLITDALEKLVSASKPSLNTTAIVAVVIALFSARTGMGSLMEGLNIACEVPEKRSFIMQQVIALALTVGAVVFAVVALTTVAGVPVVLHFLPLGQLTEIVISLSRWPLLAVLVFIGLAVIYRFAPSLPLPQWRFFSRGAIAAALLWIGGSALFSFYVSKFGDYDATYGSLGAVAILMLWLWLSALLVLLGATIDAEVDRKEEESPAPQVKT